jgi:hypothetical protein
MHVVPANMKERINVIIQLKEKAENKKDKKDQIN